MFGFVPFGTTECIVSTSPSAKASRDFANASSVAAGGIAFASPYPPIGGEGGTVHTSNILKVSHSIEMTSPERSRRVVSVALSSCQFRIRSGLFQRRDTRSYDAELTLRPLHSAVWTFLGDGRRFRL